MIRFARRSPLYRPACAAVFLLAAAAVPPTAWAQSAPAAAVVATSDDPTGFVRRLGHDAAEIAADQSRSPAERRVALARLLAAGVDVPTIGKFALGRYWRTATPEQQHAYLDVFGRYLVSIYADRLEGQGGRELEVLGAQPDGDAIIVHSRIARPNGNPPLRLDWKLSRGGDGYRIVDVLVEDVSLAITQRSDFTGAIERNHGNLQALIEALKSKVAAG